MSDIVNVESKLIGCFGQPVWENPTEYMMEAAFKHHGIKFKYITTEVGPENLKAAFEGVKALGFKGFNCTLPHKQTIIPYLDGLGESAQLMGAVNCVVERDGKYIGENTDGKGFVESLEEMTSAAGKNITIIGAGGAARAIAVELALSGAENITIANRSEGRGQDLVDLINEKTPSKAQYKKFIENFNIPERTDVLINATNIGLYPDPNRIEINLDSLSTKTVVADVVFNPPLTRLLSEAQSKGCPILDGLGMLVNQGKIGIKYWSGLDPDRHVMREALCNVFGLSKSKAG